MLRSTGVSGIMSL